ncbi:hypothetical protein Kpol_1062p53 [Vanderwaltozyma polyspora DSM 70294]|uniref:Uncharacterized protein n=1 Tax=Vanderwaltozyma polyspora (strain ATCC 22028 / DSM 70294 / BCRC 21397 / CBS 2163 / NBRC 10782 / NRRL Y-8283 / UCD 57-17) TaxID=436907 RepID=A7TKA8_VANPO|nr:uncharacterized protein Kpol_1062p53 [Vanderwaltozyma polyspora DSM 70294]EDO17343.1 hypothetical protein Kpol_1062p53 [Vanderwaltozyma polyspora DSM 70294]
MNHDDVESSNINQDKGEELKVKQNDTYYGISDMTENSKIHTADTSVIESSVANEEVPDQDLEVSRNISRFITWSTLPNIYTAIGAYGGPSAFIATLGYYVIGTTKGTILIFNSKQYLKAILIPKLSYDSSSSHLKSPVSTIAISSDGTYLAASFKTNDIYLWDLNSNQNNTQHNVSVSDTSIVPLYAILHIDDHISNDINGLGFLGTRHTALIVSDNSGTLDFHDAYRNHIWYLTYKTKNLVKLASNEKLLCSKTAPQGEIKTEFHLVAILTSKKFAIISTTPYLSTVYLENISKNCISNSFVNNCISWNKNGINVAYSIGSTMVVLVSDIKKINVVHVPKFNFKSYTSKFDESILSIFWISETIVGALTISHQFFIVDFKSTSCTISSVDLLVQDMLIPPDKNFAINDNKIFLLTGYTFKVGKFMTWSEIILNRVQNGKYFEALKFVEACLQPYFPLSLLFRLNESLESRQAQLKLPFLNLSLASMRFILKRDETSSDELYRLMTIILRVANMFKDLEVQDQLRTSLLEQSIEFYGKQKGGDISVFYDVIIENLNNGTLKSLPASVFQSVLQYYAKEGRKEQMKNLIIILDPSTLDVDLAVRICNEFKLTDTLIYIWNVIFQDYVSPFISFISSISQLHNKTSIFPYMNEDEYKKVFEYIKSIIRGIQYSSNEAVPSKNMLRSKLELNYILFNATLIEWPYGSSEKLHTLINFEDEPVYPYFNLLLRYDCAGFLDVLSVFFQEDELLNEDRFELYHNEHQMWVSRQYIVDIIIDILKDTRDHLQKYYLAIFLSKNIPSYPQFIKVSNTFLELISDTIVNSITDELHDELEISLESLLTIYVPPNLNNFISEIKALNFNRILYKMFTKTHQFVELLNLLISSKNIEYEYGNNWVKIMLNILEKTENNSLERARLIPFLSEKFDVLVEKMGVETSVEIFGKFDNLLHLNVKLLQNENTQLQYLEKLFDGHVSVEYIPPELRKQLLYLSCKLKNTKELILWIQNLEVSTTELHEMLHYVENVKDHEIIAALQKKLKNHIEVVNEMIKCIRIWFSEDKNTPDDLSYYIETAVLSASSCSGPEKDLCWSQLIVCLMVLYGKLPTNSTKRDLCNKSLQHLFINLAMTETSKSSENINEFCHILTSVLENQDVIFIKAKIVRDLLEDIFNSYKLEKEISKVVAQILEVSSFEIMHQYKDKLEEGWVLKEYVCEICGKFICGSNINNSIYLCWEGNRKQDVTIEDKEPVHKESLIVFHCGHGFHRQCLQNLGQKSKNYQCLSCQGNYNKKQ